MPPAQTRTDREFSSASSEYLWDIEGETSAHGYLFKPVVEQLRARNARRVLDLGCGNGAFTAMLGRAGFVMTGLDHSASGVALARRSHPGIPFAQHDIHQPLPAAHAGAYDAVVSAEVVEHLLLPRCLMESAHQALKPGGLLIVTTPYHGYWKNLALALTNSFDEHWHPLRDYGHIKFFSRQTLAQLFRETGFEPVEYRTAGRIPAFAKSMIMTGVRQP